MMDLELVEPLRSSSRTRCAASARSSGLPEDIVWRQPFPGPGLAVRIIGDVTEERLATLREADAIVSRRSTRPASTRALAVLRRAAPRSARSA